MSDCPADRTFIGRAIYVERSPCARFSITRQHPSTSSNIDSISRLWYWAVQKTFRWVGSWRYDPLENNRKADWGSNTSTFALIRNVCTGTVIAFSSCSLDEAPGAAITVTVRALLKGWELFCCVPGIMRAQAVRSALESPINGLCPAPALRTDPRCTLYLDPESSFLCPSHG